MVRVQRLTAAGSVDRKRVGARPAADARDEVTLPEIDDADLFVRFLTREPIQLELDRSVVLRSVRLARAVRVEGRELKKLARDEIDDG